MAAGTPSRPWRDRQALMCQALQVSEGDRVLEVGTGSGDGAAVLSTLGAQVHMLKWHRRLASLAQQTLRDAGAAEVHWADGAVGWELGSPFDAIASVRCRLKRDKLRPVRFAPLISRLSDAAQHPVKALRAA